MSLWKLTFIPFKNAFILESFIIEVKLLFFYNVEMHSEAMKFKRAFLNYMQRGTAEIKMCDYNSTKNSNIR